MKTSHLKIFLAAALPIALAACSSSPKYRSAPPKTTAEPAPITRTDTPQGSEIVSGKDVVSTAREFLGTPYRMGGSSTQGVDCSGLVYRVFENHGIAVPRTSRSQSMFGEKVARGELRPGDLVFFRTTRSGGVSHVGIYAGRGEFIHASTQQRQVKVEKLDNRYFRARFVTARRIL